MLTRFSQWLKRQAAQDAYLYIYVYTSGTLLLDSEEWWCCSFVVTMSTTNWNDDDDLMLPSPDSVAAVDALPHINEEIDNGID